MWKPNVAPSQSSQVPSPTNPSTDGKTNAVLFPKTQPQALIGKSIRIKGEITGSESLRVEGRVEGFIRLAGSAVHIGTGATVVSEITARELVVCGTLEGNSTVGERLDIRNGGSITGKVMTKRISIEEGAHFKGSIEMRHVEDKSKADESIPPVEKEEPQPVANEVA